MAMSHFPKQKCFINFSNVEITGQPTAQHISETQRIHDNTQNQIRASKESFPYTKWNAIWYDYNTYPLIHWELGNTDPAIADISNNFWGAPEFFNPVEDFYPTNAFNWNPVWNLGYGPPPTSDDELLFNNAGIKTSLGDLEGAKNDYLQLVDLYPSSIFAESALKEMLPLEEDMSQDYISLQEYYLTNQNIQDYPNLQAVGTNLANWCNVEMENYQDAIAYYNSVLENPASFNDSIFALLDIDYINTLIENGGYKSSENESANFFDLKEKEERDQKTDHYSDLLFPQRKISEQMQENLKSLKSGELVQNFPNPFSQNTEIWYKTEKPANVIIRVYDYTGKLVNSLDQGIVTGGNHKALFVSENLSPGLYFYTMVTDGVNTDTKKMTIMK